MPFFSTVIPTYNRQSLVGRTLDSVLAQPEPPEVIVVDDGSTDRTLEVVERYRDRGVTILRQQNRGPGAARNLGIRQATGEYVAFLDSDDLWFPWTLATYRRVIEHHNRPAFVTGQKFIFEGDDAPLPTAPGDLTVEAFKDYFASGDKWRWFSASSFVIRRDALLAVGGFTDEWVNGEDTDLAMRLGTAGGFVHVTSPHTFGWRDHAGSAMSNLQRSYEGLRRLIDQESAGKFPGGPDRLRERVEIITMFTRPLALEFLKRGQISLAKDLYRRTFQWHVKLGRWKFLAAFPLLAMKSKNQGDLPAVVAV